MVSDVGRGLGVWMGKGSVRALGEPCRKCKGRYVCQGSEVKDQSWEAAIFQELGSSPAAMEAGNSCDFYGLLPGNRSEQSDAEQAYTQSLLSGAETWVILPRDRWPASWIARGLRPLFARLGWPCMVILTRGGIGNSTARHTC